MTVDSSSDIGKAIELLIDNEINYIKPALLRSVLYVISGKISGPSDLSFTAESPLNYNVFSNVFSLAKSGELSDGYLLKEDWIKFNSGVNNLVNKLDKVSTVTGNAMAYVKNAAGNQVMYEIAAPSFEFIYGAAAYGGVFDAYAYDRNLLSNNARSIPSSFAVTNAIAAATIPDATTVIKGKLKLAGDLAGTADLPTVPGLSTKINNYEKGASNGVATLGLDGKVPNSQIPALAISETFPVSSQAQMLALSGAEQGDIAIRSDISKSFILRISPASTLGNWSELLTPTDAVTSVNGQVGVVSLTTANISDSTDKRYQTDNQKLYNDATSSIQTQLNAKAIDGNVLHNSGNEPFTGVKSSANTSTIQNGGLSLTNNGSGSSQVLLVNNTSSAYGASFNTTGSGNAIQVSSSNSVSVGVNVLNSNNGKGVAVQNSFNGIGIESINTLSGTAMYVQNDAGGFGFRLTNTGGGTGAYFLNKGVGNSFRINSDTGSTGDLLVFQKNAVTTAKFDQNGRYSISGGLATEYLKADGSVSTLNNPITGTGTANFIPKFTASGVLGNSSIQTDVSGNATINGGSGADVLTLNKSTGASISLSGTTGATQSVKLIADNTSNPDFLAYVGGSERLRIQATTGNVGIGTATPTVKLDIRGANNSISSTLQITGTTTSSLLLGQNSDGGIIRGQGGNGALAFWTEGISDQAAGASGSEKMRIAINGNALVGTTIDNGAKLQVNGQGFFKNGIKLGANSNSPDSNSSWIQAEDDSVAIFLTNASVSKYAGLQANGNFITSGNAVIQGTISTTGISTPYQSKTDLEAFNETPLASSRTITTNAVIIPSEPTAFGYLETFRYESDAFGMQRFTIFTGPSSGKMYVRVRNTTGWTDWVEK